MVSSLSKNLSQLMSTALCLLPQKGMQRLTPRVLLHLLRRCKLGWLLGDTSLSRDHFHNLGQATVRSHGMWSGHHSGHIKQFVEHGVQPFLMLLTTAAKTSSSKKTAILLAPKVSKVRKRLEAMTLPSHFFLADSLTFSTSKAAACEAFTCRFLWSYSYVRSQAMASRRDCS